MSSVGKTSGMGSTAGQCGGIDDETGGPAGHIESRHFVGTSGKGPVGPNGVAVVNLVYVGKDGHIDPNVKLTPGHADSDPMNEFLKSSDEDLLKKFRASDPDLLAMLKDKTEGPLTLMHIQDALNAENRMYTMLSNMQNIEHETNKAIISNMRG